MVKWSAEQYEAIFNTKKGNYLISASAGSGKTSVLTERVYELIKEGTSLDGLLVLTFTNAAAGEMRKRIREELEKNGYVELAASIDAVNIQTFDAFAFSLVKKYHYVLGLPKKLNVVDQTILSLERRKIIDEILLQKYRDNDPILVQFVSKYVSKNDDSIVDLIIDLYDEACLKVDKREFLNTYMKHYYSEEKICANFAQLFAEYKKDLDFCVSLFKQLEFTDYANEFELYIDTFANVSSYEELYKLFHGEPIKAKDARGALSLNDYPGDKTKIAYIKKVISSYKDDFVFASADEAVDRAKGISKYVEFFIDIVKELDQRLDAFKKDHESYSFADIASFANQIVQKPDINAKLKKKFVYIMVDEYQDTSDIQESFISSISSDNVYAVGDVKQSIYRFRNANPKIFLDKFNAYSRGEDGKKLDLPHNFRSRKEVLKGINDLFNLVMTRHTSGIDYRAQHAMAFGNASFDKCDDKNINHAITRIAYDVPENMITPEFEARLIAADIIAKINAGYKVKDKDSLRPATFADFAILTYSKTNYSIYQKVFNEYQVPLFASYNESLRENNLTMVLENIVRLLDLCDHQQFDRAFLHAYLSILRSFLFECDNQLVEDIASTLDYRKSELFNILTNLYKDTVDLNLANTMKAIIERFAFYEKIPTIGDASNNLNLLNYYYQIAQQMDDMGYNLDDFVAYFTDLKSYDIEPEYESSDDISDSVQLMSIHKSKGLQFKIVYYPEIYKRFNNQMNQKTIVLDDEYGVALPNFDYVDRHSPERLLISKNEKREVILDYERLFYVALTRAEEKIILLTPNEFRKSDVTSFNQINHLYDFVLYAGINYDVDIVNLQVQRQQKEEEESKSQPALNVHQPLALDDTKILPKRASKSESNNEGVAKLLELGNRYHHYLELVDFASKDVSFIKDDDDRKRLEKFLSNAIFKDASKAKVAHEYAFYDEVNSVHGVIDLLLVYANHIDIVDYKLSHVDDEAYERQVSIYKDYISTISKLPIHTYVVGILSGDIKQIA